MVMSRLIILTVFVLVNDTDKQPDHKFCIPLLQQIAMLSGADKQLGGGGRRGGGGGDIPLLYAIFMLKQLNDKQAFYSYSIVTFLSSSGLLC